MSDAFEIASIGLRNYQGALEVLAGNITNVNTTSYKRMDVRFADVLAHGALSQTNAALGVHLVTASDPNAVGDMQQTGVTMDLAIDGQGFIELMGPDGQSVLWRGGRLTVTETGQLASDMGLELRSPITVPRDSASLDIEADGRVFNISSLGEREEIGTIDIVRAFGGGAMESMGRGQFKAASDARLEAFTPGEDGAGRLMQGALERSNVEISREMVELMLVQRGFAANAQVLQAADQLMTITNNLRR